MAAICGIREGSKPGEIYSTRLPLDNPPPAPIIFPGREFHITGRFAYGARTKVVEAIETKGGVASDTMPTSGSHYLVIGVFATREWVNTNFGRKIERAIELRSRGSGIAIISEEHWKKFLS
jgi:NAD-dependent DNA ligase